MGEPVCKLVGAHGPHYLGDQQYCVGVPLPPASTPPALPRGPEPTTLTRSQQIRAHALAAAVHIAGQRTDDAVASTAERFARYIETGE